jgi:acyl-CoA thioesterase-2
VTTDQPAPLLDLLATLDLEELGSAQVSVQPLSTAGALAGRAPEPLPETFAEDITLFRGQSQKQPHGRVFGGQVLAQGVVACGRTVRAVEGGGDRRLHSIHAYFMRPGDDTQPITFSVERMRDGRSFSTRRVHAIQHGKPILSMSASFQTPDQGMDHQDAMPEAPDPMTVPSLVDVFAGVDHPGARHLATQRAIDLRHVEGNLFVTPATDRVADQRVWMRAIGELPDDPLVHEAVLAYASDYSLLESILRRHGKGWRTTGLRAASLDHAMWFHRPARADQWLLYAQHSPSAQGGRGLGIGRMFTADGTLVATVAQEGMLRVPDA